MLYLLRRYELKEREGVQRDPQEGLTELGQGGAADHSEVQHSAAEATWNQHVDCLILWALYWNLNCIDNKIL